MVGLGLLGSALAERLMAERFDVVGYDVDAAKTGEFAARGMMPAASPAEVALRARRVILSLPNSDVVESVVEGPGGVVETLQTGDTVVDTTTADPERTKALAARLRRRGVEFVDATVLGSSKQAAERDVVIMAGGSAEALAGCADILSAFSDHVFHMGEVGKGTETKLIVNLVLGLNRLVLAEALVLGRKAGIDMDALLDVLRGGAAYSRVMDTKGRKMLDGDFEPQARLAQHLKDVGLILDFGARTNAPLPLSALHQQILRSGVAQGLGDLDNSAVIRVQEAMAGLPGE